MKFILTVFFFFILHSGFSQGIKSDSIYKQKDLDVEAEFNVNKLALFKFVGTKFKAPPNVTGKMYVEFVVEVDGTLSNFYVKKDLGPAASAEAIRVLKTSPIWKPGQKDGRAVRSLYSLPIVIQNR